MNYEYDVVTAPVVANAGMRAITAVLDDYVAEGWTPIMMSSAYSAPPTVPVTTIMFRREIKS